MSLRQRSKRVLLPFSRKEGFFRGAAIVGVALVVEYATQFGRSVVLSHGLGPAEFGIGSAIVILWALVDMSTGVGADRYIVQAAEGDTPECLAAAHTVTLLRNVLSAAVILALAAPTAAILGVPQARGSFLWLAAVPLIRGFEHLRVSQNQRWHDFRPWAVLSASTCVFGLACVTAAAFVLHDHRAVLWSLGAQAVALVVSTHVMARVPYRVSLSGRHVMHALRFGTPLMLNGLALAAIGQVDRLAVGSFLGVVQLGRYGLATMLFYLPVSLIMRIVSSTMEPRAAAAWHASPGVGFPQVVRRTSLAVAAIAVAMSVAVALLGNTLVGFVFGAPYRVDDGFFAILSFAVLMRFAKIMLNFVALTMGRTLDVMLSNLPSMLGLAATVAGLALLPSLQVAACGALAGETLGAAAALVLVRRTFRDRTGGSWSALLTVVPVPFVAAAWSVLAHPAPAARLSVLAVGMLACLAGIVLLQRKRDVLVAG